MSRTILKSYIFFYLLLFGSYAFTTSSIAQGIKPWTNLNINGGQISDIAIDPCNPLKMFAGSYLGDGLYISEDGGNNWKGVLTGYESTRRDVEETFRNSVVMAVKIAPPPYNDIIWVANDRWIKKSIDGGKTWRHIYNETIQRDCPNCGGEADADRSCMSLAIHPSNPQIVYVGTTGPGGHYVSGAIFKTEDGGSTWNKLSLNPDPVHGTLYSVVDLAINPNAPDIIWALTYGSLYRSEDGGDNWDWIDSFYTCHDLEIKPNDPNEIFIANLLGVLKVYYDQDLKEWEWTSVEPASSNVRALAFDPQDPEVLYASWIDASDGSISIVAKSANGGTDWELYSVDNQFKVLKVHPTNSEVIYGGDFNLGLYKSTDHGQTWTPINSGINAVSIYDIDINPNNRSHILTATSSGVYEKKGDNDWLLISDFEYTSAYSIVFHPNKSQTYYAGIDRQFAKTTDGGKSWTFTEPLDSYDVYAYNCVTDIAVNSTPQTTEIFISVDGFGDYGEIYKSIDGGDTFKSVWEGVNKEEEKYGFNTVAIDPSDPNHIFAGGGNFYDPEVNGDLFESFDSGLKWTPTGLQDVVVNSILINPDDPNIIYAGCGPGSRTEFPLYKSINGGKTFNSYYLGMREKWIPLQGVWGDDPNNIFFVCEKGDILNNIRTWSFMDSNTFEDLMDIWGTSPTDVFAVGANGTVIHYDGDTWSAIKNWTKEDLMGIWGTSPTDVFAVGANGTVLHYDGTWSAMISGTKEDLMGVWGTSSIDVFAVGSNGTILHYNGAAWSAMNSSTKEDLSGVWGTSASDVFAVGSNGAILHYDGTWSAMNSNTTISLSSVWGTSSTDVFVAGNENSILHYDSNSWTKMDIGLTGEDPLAEEDLLDIWGSSKSDIFIIGNMGSIIHYNGNAWTIIKRWLTSGNSVVDLEFHPQNKDIIYAGTPTTGIYISPNQGKNWLNIGKPDFFVHAIATSSLYAGTEGGLWQCTGTGIITGKVRDPNSDPIDNALVFNDWVRTRSINGEYLLVSPAGICDVAVITDDYIYKLAKNITVYGGDVAWVDFGIQRGIPNLLPVPDSNGDQDGVFGFIGDQDGEGKTCFIGTAARF